MIGRAGHAVARDPERLGPDRDPDETRRRAEGDGQLCPRVRGQRVVGLARGGHLTVDLHVLDDEAPRYRAEPRIARVGPNHDAAGLALLTQVRLSLATRPAHRAQLAPVLQPEPSRSQLVFIAGPHFEHGAEARPHEMQPWRGGPPRVAPVLGAVL